MIETAIEFSRYFAAMLFGMVVAVSFVGMPSTRKNYLVLGCFTVVVFIIQVACLFHWGMDTTWKMYPLLAHFPIAAFIALYLKRSWLIALTSMVTTFLCCQPPRWIGSVLGDIFGSATMNHLGYIFSVILMYYILQKYVTKSVQHLMERSVKSCLIFGAVPAFYYLVDFPPLFIRIFCTAEHGRLYSSCLLLYPPFILSLSFFTMPKCRNRPA